MADLADRIAAKLLDTYVVGQFEHLHYGEIGPEALAAIVREVINEVPGEDVRPISLNEVILQIEYLVTRKLVSRDLLDAAYRERLGGDECCTTQDTERDCGADRA